MTHRYFIVLTLFAGLLAVNMPVQGMSPYTIGAIHGFTGAVPGAGFGAFLGLLSQTEGPRSTSLAVMCPIACATFGGAMMGGLSAVNNLALALKAAAGGGAVGLGIGMIAGVIVYSIVTSDAKNKEPKK